MQLNITFIDGFFDDESIEIINDDIIPEISKQENRICKKGDLWILGRHRLLCGDSTNSEDVNKLMQKDKAHMIFTDPPYNIGFSFKNGVSTKGKYSKENEYNDSKSEEEYYTFLTKFLQNALQHTKKNIHVFVWCDQRYIWIIQKLLKANNIKSERVALWLKNNFNPLLNTAFHKCYEPCVYGKIGSPHLNNKFRTITEIMNAEIKSKEVFSQLLCMIDIWISKRERVNDYLHPTQKPVDLFYKPFKRCSNIGDIILDSFGGSGTTIIACEKMKRKARVIEFDPYYCDVIIKRWEDYTGKKARLS